MFVAAKGGFERDTRSFRSEYFEGNVTTEKKKPYVSTGVYFIEILQAASQFHV